MDIKEAILENNIPEVERHIKTAGDLSILIDGTDLLSFAIDHGKAEISNLLRTVKQWAIINQGGLPHKLVALTFATKKEVRAYLRREFRLNDYRHATELPFFAFDAKTSSVFEAVELDL